MSMSQAIGSGGSSPGKSLGYGACVFFFQAEDGIRDYKVTGVQTCALPISMIFGITKFTLIHVVLSLIGILAGLVVAGGLAGGKRLGRWALVFLVTTILTSATGFGFPFVTLLPSHIVGIVSLVVLAAVVVAQYVKHFA